jgi:hypothetical protein
MCVFRSEINPEGSVGEDSCEGQIFPKLSVSHVAVRGNFPVNEFIIGRGSWENLTSVSISIYLQ